jgi:hypothetical protein
MCVEDFRANGAVYLYSGGPRFEYLAGDVPLADFCDFTQPVLADASIVP